MEEEYEADELVNDSEDEKKQYRVEWYSKKRKATADNAIRICSKGEGASRPADMQPRPPPSLPIPAKEHHVATTSC